MLDTQQAPTWVPTLRACLQALAMQGGLVVEGDETEEELVVAVTHLVETNARRPS